MNRKEKIMKRMQEHLEELEKRNYKVVGIFLQGSQNYDLDYEGSDIDTKAIVLPTFEQIVFNTKPVSTTLILENDEHIDVKDIRIMFSCFKKQNINFLEILFTDYFILNKDYDLETARKLAKESIDRMGKMKDEFKDTFKQSINITAEEILNEVLYNVLKKAFKDEFDSEE